MSKMPMKPGYYWAKWRIAAEGTVEGDELTPSDFWEITQVNENDPDWERNPAEDMALSVSLCGVSETQWRDCFVWGDFVAPLHNEPLPQPAPAQALVRPFAEAARIATAAAEDAPSNHHDNGATRDGWEMACKEIAMRLTKRDSN
ncbi:hypothetical protein [Mesorhizobium sp.]|uniref:hypothetical protein n=1 Tax=Mesorhizobium sp. TaxID=1871066 RepID=UPI000FE9ADE0|nr:hypothetical protein [Mesorhizobium sp.]RWD43908.1 MAG: hypothetical protein EOS35_18690 [Mesorhizobium sp.]TIU09875.1 MAG: hypothetical protein E5W39_01935 [Mesorhizobium sp.]